MILKVDSIEITSSPWNAYPPCKIWIKEVVTVTMVY